MILKTTSGLNVQGKMVQEYEIPENTNLFQIEQLPVLVGGEIFPIPGIYHKLPKVDPIPLETYMDRLKEEMAKFQSENRWYLTLVSDSKKVLEEAEKQITYLQNLPPKRFKLLALYSQTCLLGRDDCRPTQEEVLKALAEVTISLEIDPEQKSEFALPLKLEFSKSPEITLKDLYTKCPELDGFGVVINLFCFTQILVGVSKGRFTWKKIYCVKENGDATTYERGLKGEMLLLKEK